MRTPTPLPPSCLAHPPHHPHLLLTGSYDLSPAGTKSGSLTLWHVSPPTALHTLPTAAILDVKFSPRDPSLFAACTHDGYIHLYTLDPADCPTRFTARASWDVRPPGVTGDRGVVTYISWHADGGRVAFALTSGEVGVVEVEGGAGGWERRHGAEAWVVEWGAGGRGLWSGGDDGVLVGAGEGWVDRRTHGAGVTAIVVGGRGVVTGSYDEVMREWDERAGRWGVVREVAVGGGVWRVVPGLGGWVVAGMHAGPKVVREVEGEWKVVKEWGPMNLCYGVAVHPDVERRVAWCSFYDKILCVEDVDI